MQDQGMQEQGGQGQSVEANFARVLSGLSRSFAEDQLLASLKAVAGRDLPCEIVEGEDGWTLEWRGGDDHKGRAAFEVFQATVDQLRSSLHLVHRAARVGRMVLAVAGKGESAAAIQEALPTLAREFGVESIQGVRDRHGALLPEPKWSLGSAGELPIRHEEFRAVRGGQPAVLDGGLLLPLQGHWQARGGLWLDAPDRQWTPDELGLLTMLGRALGIEYERVQAQRHLSALLDMQAQLLKDDPENAYQPLLEQAIRLIPGAECGSLLVRNGDVFRYAASVTFDDRELGDVTFRVADTRDYWYGRGEEAWNAGVPRIVRDSRLYVQGRGYARDGDYQTGALRSVDQIAASIGVPILHQGEVYAFLNIDSLSDADAFGEDSMEVARSFAVQAALLLHESSQRARIREAARTDELTGLPNRRAFTDDLATLIARARRDETPLTLLVGDVTRFKVINDTLGHTAGDTALIKVGDILRTCLRPGDRVYRWGGDEFAMLLPHTTLEDAQRTRDLIRREMEGRRVERLPLAMNLGLAQLRPGDRDGDLLLREADAAMYAEKRAGQGVAAPGS